MQCEGEQLFCYNSHGIVHPVFEKESSNNFGYAAPMWTRLDRWKETHAKNVYARNEYSETHK